MPLFSENIGPLARQLWTKMNTPIAEPGRFRIDVHLSREALAAEGLDPERVREAVRSRIAQAEPAARVHVGFEGPGARAGVYANGDYSPDHDAEGEIERWQERKGYRAGVQAVQAVLGPERAARVLDGSQPAPAAPEGPSFRM